MNGEYNIVIESEWQKDFVIEISGQYDIVIESEKLLFTINISILIRFHLKSKYQQSHKHI